MKQDYLLRAGIFCLTVAGALGVYLIVMWFVL